jgi:hypothetical protein
MAFFPLVMVPGIGFGLFGSRRIGRKLATGKEKLKEQSVTR